MISANRIKPVIILWLLLAILLFGCQQPTLESGFDIPVGTFPTSPSRQVPPDSVLISPFHANWSYVSPITVTAISLGNGVDAPHVSYRDAIGTQSGQTRYNIIDMWIPGKTIESENITLKLANTYSDLGVKRILENESDFDGHYRIVLILDIPSQTKSGDYKIEILVFINGKYYGDLPCVIHVIE